MPLKSPEEYRQRAERARAMAVGVKQPSVAEALLRVAANYDSMAEQVEVFRLRHEGSKSRGDDPAPNPRA